MLDVETVNRIELAHLLSVCGREIASPTETTVWTRASFTTCTTRRPRVSASSFGLRRQCRASTATSPRQGASCSAPGPRGRCRPVTGGPHLQRRSLGCHLPSALCVQLGSTETTPPPLDMRSVGVTTGLSIGGCPSLHEDTRHKCACGIHMQISTRTSIRIVTHNLPSTYWLGRRAGGERLSWGPGAVASLLPSRRVYHVTAV